MEQWKPILGYEGIYLVSSIGRIKSLERIVERGVSGPLRVKEKIRVCPLNTSGYPSIGLSKTGVITQHRVHRLVAQAFIPNLDTLPQVNHINGIKTDNRVENLEWITLMGNIYHAIEHLGSKYGHHDNRPSGFNSGVAQPVLCINPDGSKYYFQTVIEASRQLGIKRTTITAKLTGQNSPFTKDGKEVRRITKEQFLTYIN